MKNYVQEGEVVTITAPRTVVSGEGVLVGTTLFGVAVGDIASGATGEIKTCGVFDLTALSTDTAAVGALLYWDNTNFRLTTTSAGNTKVGVAVATKPNPQSFARIRLNGAW